MLRIFISCTSSMRVFFKFNDVFNIVQNSFSVLSRPTTDLMTNRAKFAVKAFFLFQLFVSEVPFLSL